jgi:hypothetical protein
MDSSGLWLLVVFVIGGGLGVLTMALMNVSAGLPRQRDTRVDDSIKRPESWGPSTELRVAFNSRSPIRRRLRRVSGSIATSHRTS